jgi:nucleoside-diphosphate-sugar epimerase
MSVLIAGARGYIGAAAFRRLRANGTKVLPVSSSPSEDFSWLDLGNSKSFDSISICEGAFILRTAAISSPDVCAKETELVRYINFEGTNAYISCCIRQGVRQAIPLIVKEKIVFVRACCFTHSKTGQN